MHQTKRIALLIETSTSYGRTLIRGILQYANVASSWIFYNEPRGFGDAVPKLTKDNLDGIIMRDTPENMPLLALKIPTVVSIRYEKRIPEVPNIISDSKEIGIMAAKYLQDKGFEHFAFCGFDDMPWSREREQAFIDAAGCTSKTFIHRKKQQKQDYDKQLQDLADWLFHLPKPIGLMACNDVRGANIIEACKLAEVKVPQEVSIVGVNNDDMICQMTSPPLSSISLNIAKAGYEAAKTLDRLIKGKLQSIEDIVIKPENVITRTSTDIFAINDPLIAAAMHYISKNCKQNIQVDDVADAIGMNRRCLERRFRTILGKTVYEEIKRKRINIIGKMLTETDIPISEIAYNMDFNDANHISRYFKSAKGISPLQYRKSHSGILTGSF